MYFSQHKTDEIKKKHEHGRVSKTEQNWSILRKCFKKISNGAKFKPAFVCLSGHGLQSFHAHILQFYDMVCDFNDML